MSPLGPIDRTAWARTLGHGASAIGAPRPTGVTLLLLGAPGAFLAMPLTFFLIVLLASFPGTRWLSEVMTVNAASLGATRSEASEALEAAGQHAETALPVAAGRSW